MYVVLKACLSSVKCPRYPSKEPTIESHFKGKDLENWNKFRVFIENLETPKRQCLVRAVGDSYRKVFVDCLNQFKLGIHAQPLEDKVSLDGNILKLL